MNQCFYRVGQTYGGLGAQQVRDPGPQRSRMGLRIGTRPNEKNSGAPSNQHHNPSQTTKPNGDEGRRLKKLYLKIKIYEGI